MKPAIDRVPPLAAWTEDVTGVERRFTPFAAGTAPDPDQAGVRAMNATAAREAVDWVGTWPRRLAVPCAVTVAFAVTAELSWLGSRTPSIDGPVLAFVIGCVLGLATHALIRQRCIWRHRGFAARTALLTLGRCGTCGFLLRGALRRVGSKNGETIELCQCSECGSLWPAVASEHPRRSDTGARVDLPEVTGLDAARTRMRLVRALRAQPSDFLLDDAGEPRYIAHMDGEHRRGVGAFARDLFDAASATAMGVAVGALMVGCAGACGANLIRALFAPDAREPFGLAMAAGAEAGCMVLVVLAGAAFASRFLTPRHRRLQSRRLHASGECPCCTMPLRAERDPDGLAHCTCCSAAWRA